MGQKTSPIALRLDINRQWDSSWNSPYHYENLLGREIQLRKYFAQVFQRANLLCGRLVIHWNPQSIQIYPFLFPGKPKKSKRKKTKAKLARRPSALSPQGQSRYKASQTSTKALPSRIVTQIESQRLKILRRHVDFHKQVLFQRENLVKTSLRYRKCLKAQIIHYESNFRFWKLLTLQGPSRPFYKKSCVVKSLYPEVDLFALDSIFQWDSKKHLWQRKKYLASWGITSYKKQKIKKVKGNLFAYLNKEKEGKVRKKEKYYKNKVLVKKGLNSLKKKRTLAKKKSTAFTNKRIRLHIRKNFSKSLYKASPKQRKHLFSNQGLTFFGRVFLQRPKNEKSKQKGKLLGKKKHYSSLETPKKTNDLVTKNFWDLTKEERIVCLDEKKSSFSRKKRRLLLKPQKSLQGVTTVALAKRPLKAPKGGASGKRTGKPHTSSPSQVLKRKKAITCKSLKKRFKQIKQSLDLILWPTGWNSKPLNPRSIRCYIRSITKTRGYCIMRKLEKKKLVVEQKSTTGRFPIRRTRLPKGAALPRGAKAWRLGEASRVNGLKSASLKSASPKTSLKDASPRPKVVTRRNEFGETPFSLGKGVVSFQRPCLSKLSENSKDFWKKKFSSKKAFLQVSLASAFISSCWREKLFAIRAQLLHNFFLCESLSLLPTQSVWQKKRNKFKNSTALRYLEEYLQKIYQSQVQILPIKLKNSLPYKAEPVFCYQSALVLAQQLARAIEKKKIRTYRQVVRTALKQAKHASWLHGVRITCSGRLGRVDLAKQETKAFGETSLHVFSKKIDYGFASARTKKVGIVGIKVWLSFV